MRCNGKEKKDNIKHEDDELEEESGGVITIILYCDNTNCDYNADSGCTNEEGIYLDENGTCTSAKYIESEGIISSNGEEDWIDIV